MKNRLSFIAVLTAFAFVLAAALGCDSDLLGSPPSSAIIDLVSPPTETAIGTDTATIACTTTAVATVGVEYGIVSGAYTNAVPRTTSESTEHSVVFSGLAAETVYYYRVVSWLNGTRSFYSVEYSFTTAADPTALAIATGPSATSAPTSLAIGFTTNDLCTSVVEYGTASGAYATSTLQTSSEATTHSASLTGLSSGTTYYYRIKLYWNTGDDFASIEYTATTSSETAPTSAQKARGVWILGGISGAVVTAPLAEVDLYDPVTDTWYPAVTSTTGYTPVSFAGYAAYDGKLYVIGGFDGLGNTQNITQIYTISSDSWTTGSTMTTVRANIFATLMDGKIYVLSGTSGANYTTAWAAAGVAYEYTPGGTWTQKTGYTATANSERFSYAYGSTLYGIGGRSSATLVAALAHEGFVPWVSGAGSITTLTETAMATNRTGVTGVIYDAPDGVTDSVILLGGFSAVTGTTGCFINFPTTASCTASSLVQYLGYPFSAPSAWSLATNGIPTGAAGFGAVVVSRAFASARIYLFGGTSSIGTSPAVSTVAAWIPPPAPPAAWNDTWTTVTSMPRARWGHGAVTLNE